MASAHPLRLMCPECRATLEIPAGRTERGASRRSGEDGERPSDVERGEGGMPLPHQPLTHRLLVLMLSSLEAGSAFMPISRRIRRSLSLLPRGWLMFYLLSAGMAVVGLAAATFAFSARLAVSLICMVVLAVILVLYFRLLGRLAWCCREAIAEVETEEETSLE